jgi:uncharacterized cupin superfamily protein
MNIVVEKGLTERQIAALGIKNWPIWTKEISAFPWHYDETEVCYFLEGEVLLTQDDGGPSVTLQPGDYVVLPKGLSCRWDIKKPVRKHYNFLNP